MPNRNSFKFPCGWLVNDKQCPRGVSCPNNHVSFCITRWKRIMPSKPCNNGETCEQLTSGNCIFYHPPEHVQRDRLYIERTVDRELKMRKGLKFEGQIKVPKGDQGANVPVRIKDVRALSSFNKIVDNEIAVPGVPPRLHPLTEKRELPTDQNNKSLGWDYPTYTHPFEPLIRSIEATNIDFDWRQTDIITNASNLRKMFMIFLNQQVENERFDLTWTNNTLFLSKWTKDPHLNSSVGHGRGFEQATCIYDDHEDEPLKSSSSHHRVKQYRFGGLQLVIQSEVDAYHCDCHCPGTSNIDHTLPETMSAMTIDDVAPYHDVAKHQRRSSAVSGASSDPSTNLSVLSSVFTDSSPESHRDRPRRPTPASPPPSPCCPGPTPADNQETPCTDKSSASIDFDEDVISSPTLRVIHLGREIPASCLVEVKTHKVNNKPLFNAEAQLYFSQTSKLYVAKNSGGTFRPPTAIITRNQHGNIKHMRPVEDKTEDIEKWSEDHENQKALRKVVTLLKELKELARQHDEKKLTVLMKNDGTGKESGVRITWHHRKEEEGKGCVPGDWMGGQKEKEGELGEEEMGDGETIKGDGETVKGDEETVVGDSHHNRH